MKKHVSKHPICCGLREDIMQLFQDKRKQAKGKGKVTASSVSNVIEVKDSETN